MVPFDKLPSTSSLRQAQGERFYTVTLTSPAEGEGVGKLPLPLDRIVIRLPSDRSWFDRLTTNGQAHHERAGSPRTVNVGAEQCLCPHYVTLALPSPIKGEGIVMSRPVFPQKQDRSASLIKEESIKS